LTRFRYPEQSSEELVHELLEELVDEVVEKSEAGRREEIVQDYLSRLIPAPLIQTSEVSQVDSYKIFFYFINFNKKSWFFQMQSGGGGYLYATVSIRRIIQ